MNNAIKMKKEEYMTKLKSYYKENASRYGIHRMAVFGSVARNEQTERSDIDIAYEGDANILIRSHMKQELEELLGLPVDLVRLRKSLIGTDFYNRASKDFIYV